MGKRCIESSSSIKQCQFELLKKYHESQKTCLLKNCQISNQKNKPEIVVKTGTKIEDSTTVFNISDPEHGTTVVNLADLHSFEHYD